MRLFKKKDPFTKQLSITPPKPAADRHGVAIAVMVKNERVYIEEWIRFHQAVGIRHFYFYDDASTDGTFEIVAKTLPNQNFTVIPWHMRLADAPREVVLNAQALAFAHALLNFGAGYRWMAFIDVDEFLLPKTGDNIEDALVGAQGFPIIALPWHMFGTSGHRTRPSGPVLRNYTMRGTDPLSAKKNASNFKCIVDPSEVSRVSIHHFQSARHGELMANDAGFTATRKGRKAPAFYSSKFLQLNHYYSKSAEELEAKLARGPASPASRQRHATRVKTGMASIESDMIEDRAMIDFLDRKGIVLEVSDVPTGI
ncbi:glycosyltransferase family 92 protein [Terrihabitans sp. B22-R8]|uniref:glycosyltransferase family 92 protein n=1 Tax=Terrihabitans sp. B22-R8 TaxID=3425128 RepID=UPI00403CA1BD